MKVLILLTSHDELGNTGRTPGFWLEELAAPYYRFKDAGAEIVLTSPKGRAAAAGSQEHEPGFQPDETRRFEADPEAMAAPCSSWSPRSARLAHEYRPAREGHLVATCRFHHDAVWLPCLS